MLILFIIIQIIYKSCTCNCTCAYQCTEVTRPSTAAYPRSPLLAVFQGPRGNFPFTPGVLDCKLSHGALHCTALTQGALSCTVLFTAMCCTTLHFTVLYLFALPCTALYCTWLHCIALYLSALPCTVLCYTVLYWEGWGDAACGAGTPTTALLVVWPVLYKSDVLFINCRFIYFLLKFYKTNSFYI